MTEFLGGERSIQLSYEDGYHIIIPQLPHKIKLNRKARKKKGVSYRRGAHARHGCRMKCRCNRRPGTKKEPTYGDETIKKEKAPRRRGWLLGSSATQVICISFVLLIALGTLLLTLPISSRSGRLGVVDAMFTATSATCVTGLVVRDTWTQFTPFGQAVVLLLIQVGGLGLVTLTSFFALAAKRRMGF